MRWVFEGRPVFAANVSGEAVVSHSGFNSLASFYHAMLMSDASATSDDPDNPELAGKTLTDRILCVPKTTGSTSAGAVWDTVAVMGIAPRAVLFSMPIDSLAAAGLSIADVWAGRKICAVDRLGDAFLATVQDGDRITVREDGTVVVER
jgi:uncharacterized protein